jgi:hypothetical protein
MAKRLLNSHKGKSWRQTKCVVLFVSPCAGEEDALPPFHSSHPFSLYLCLDVWQTGGMGGGQIRTPPKNFKREFNADYMVKLTPDKLRTFCEIN